MSDGHLHAIAVSGIVPLRKEPREQAEMVSQFLLGETAQVLSIEERWVEIIMDTDGYQGWVSKSQIRFQTEVEKRDYLTQNDLIRSPFAGFRAHGSKESRWVPPGALVAFGENHISVSGFRGEPASSVAEFKKDTILETALGFLGTPYLWGGRTDTGVDCSGLIQTTFLLHGITVPRDSSRQYEAKALHSDKLSDAQPGDLIYFAFDGGRVSHVGFYMGNGSLLHASGSVCIQNIDIRKRFENKYPLHERLAHAVVGVQKPFKAGEYIPPAHFG